MGKEGQDEKAETAIDASRPFFLAELFMALSRFGLLLGDGNAPNREEEKKSSKSFYFLESFYLLPVWGNATVPGAQKHIYAEKKGKIGLAFRRQINRVRANFYPFRYKKGTDMNKTRLWWNGARSDTK
ncbi:MAG: hypothetical protein LBN38_06435 [Verrucomicrobiota bacterium]|nr:hypothetical protein [Verrucomicrobiota bacterium]